MSCVAANAVTVTPFASITRMVSDGEKSTDPSVATATCEPSQATSAYVAKAFIA